MPSEGQPALWDDTRQRETGAREHAQGFLENSLQVCHLKGLFHRNGTFSLAVLHESIDFSAEFSEHGSMAVEVVKYGTQRDTSGFCAGDDVGQDMVIDAALVEGLGVHAVARVECGQIVRLQDPRFFCFGHGFLFVKDIIRIDAFLAVFGHGVGGELVDVGEADVAFWGDHLKEAEHGGVPFGKDAHDSAVTGVGVDRRHDVCEVSAFFEEAEGFAELGWGKIVSYCSQILCQDSNGLRRTRRA